MVHYGRTAKLTAVLSYVQLGSFAALKKKKYALLFHIERFDCISQISICKNIF